MKLRKIIYILVVFILTGAYQLGCGGGSTSSPTPETDGDDPDTVELTSGLEDIATDATLKYTFSSALDADSITTSTVYIVPLGSAAPKNISADLDIAVEDYPYANSCSSERSLSGTSVESDGESVTVTSDYEYMGGVIYSLCIEGEEVAIIFSTEGDLATDCATLFNGDCDYDIEADEGTSLSYDDMVAIFDGNEEYIGMCCVYGPALGESECMSVTTIEALFESLGGGGEEEEAMSWEGETPDVDSSVIVDSLSGDSTLFTVQAKLNQDPETFGANPYRLYGSGSDTSLSTVEELWSYDEFVDNVDDNCLNEGSCAFEITGNALAEIYTEHGFGAENWNNEQRCYRIHFVMYYVGLGEGAPEGGDYTVHTSDLSFYIKNDAEATCDD